MSFKNPCLALKDFFFFKLQSHLHGNYAPTSFGLMDTEFYEDWGRACSKACLSLDLRVPALSIENGSSCRAGIQRRHSADRLYKSTFLPLYLICYLSFRLSGCVYLCFLFAKIKNRSPPAPPSPSIPDPSQAHECCLSL